MRTLAKSVLAFSLLFASGLSVAAPVNINTADAGSLASSLTGIGPKKAEAIIEYRKANGPFKSVDDLALVKGIDKAIIEKNRTNLLLK